MRANQFQAKIISCKTSSDNIFQSSLKKYPDFEIIDLDELEDLDELDEDFKEYNSKRKKNDDFVTVSFPKDIVKSTSIVAKRCNISSTGQVATIASIINAIEI